MTNDNGHYSDTYTAEQIAWFARKTRERLQGKINDADWARIIEIWTTRSVKREKKKEDSRQANISELLKSYPILTETAELFGLSVSEYQWEMSS